MLYKLIQTFILATILIATITLHTGETVTGTITAETDLTVTIKITPDSTIQLYKQYIREINYGDSTKTFVDNRTTDEKYTDMTSSQKAALAFIALILLVLLF